MAESKNLADYYKTTFLLINKHGFSLTELENMIPYEKEIYIFSLIASLEEDTK